MNNQEIIVNLWYLIDELGFINEVRGRMYIVGGSDAEKLKYLHKYTHTDFIISPSHKLPETIKTNFEDGTYNVIHYKDMKISGGEGILFGDLFNEMEKSISANSILKFPADPLTVITPLSKNDDGILAPSFTKSVE